MRIKREKKNCSRKVKNCGSEKKAEPKTCNKLQKNKVATKRRKIKYKNLPSCDFNTRLIYKKTFRAKQALLQMFQQKHFLYFKAFKHGIRTVAKIKHGTLFNDDIFDITVQKSCSRFQNVTGK